MGSLARGPPKEASAWLELDHPKPRAEAGGSEPDNVRVLCHAHDRLAAEHEFGRDHIEAAIIVRAEPERAC